MTLNNSQYINNNMIILLYHKNLIKLIIKNIINKSFFNISKINYCLKNLKSIKFLKFN